MARTRRGNGEGAIYQQKSRKGLWAASISGGYDQSGRHIRRTVYGKTKGDVREKLLDLQNKAKTTGRVRRAERETVAEFLASWLEDVARPQIRVSTHDCYERIIRRHIVPHVTRVWHDKAGEHITGVRLDRFGVDDVQRLQSALRASGQSPRIQRFVHTVLHRSLKHAVRIGKLDKNPCGRDFVDAPKYVSKEMRPLSADQAKLLLEAARSDDLEALYVLALTTGMRSGELFALRWEDVNLGEATLSVRRSLQVVGSQVAFVEPKTAAGRRRIDLTPFAVEALRAHHKRLLSDGPASPLVFPSANGSPLRRPNVTRRSFEPLLRRAGLPRIRFHDLRHTCASILLSQGISPKVIQEMLGHASITITLGTYAHLTPTMQRTAADSLEALLAPKAAAQ